MQAMSSAFPRLLGDVGGTNARWAWQSASGAPLESVRSLACDHYPHITDCIADYLKAQHLPAPRAVGFGIATAVTGDAVQMTNHAWEFSIAKLRQSLGVEQLRVLNDFEALAHAVPSLAPDQRLQVGGGQAVAGANLAVIGPGTGLGVSGLVADGRGGWRVVVGEGGHATVAATNSREADVLAVLRERFSHVSAERVVSGPGLVWLYEALCTLEKQAPQTSEPSLVLSRGLNVGLSVSTEADDPLCQEALALFVGFLGNVAGNLALTLGARGGVFIGGGIAPRLGAALSRLPLRERFEAKGRFGDYLAAIPTWVITAEAPALLGAAQALDAA
jgi:glucokinase